MSREKSAIGRNGSCGVIQPLALVLESSCSVVDKYIKASSALVLATSRFAISAGIASKAPTESSPIGRFSVGRMASESRGLVDGTTCVPYKTSRVVSAGRGLLSSAAITEDAVASKGATSSPCNGVI